MAVIGVSQPKYAVYTNNGGTISYGTVKPLGKATEVNIEITSSSDNNLYADNAIAETEHTFQDGTLTLNTDDLSQTASKDILGIIESPLSAIAGVTDEGVNELIYDNRQTTVYVGIGLVVKKIVGGETSWRAIVLPKCAFSIPADSAVTQGQTIEWQVPELTATIMRDDSEYQRWKSEATFTTEAQAVAYISARLS